MKLTHALLAATALVALAGCGKKRPPVIPPPPLQQTDPNAGQNGPPVDPNAGIAPDSDAAFRRDVQSNTVLFGTDQYDIDPTARAILDAQASWLAQHPRVRITIEGHCDERGTREYNLALGDRRANAAKNYLAARGVDASRMTTISYGKERPAALGSDDDSWAQNRRAVTIVLG